MVDSENDENPVDKAAQTDLNEDELLHDDELREELNPSELEDRIALVTGERSIDVRKLEMAENLNDPMALIERVYQIWWRWADFELYVVSPNIPLIDPPIILRPELISGTNEREFVYSIHDYGSKLSTSKSEEMFSAGMSMCKLYYTIEKMIFLLIERLKSAGIDTNTEVQVAFSGHILAQRKAFESIINLSYNVVVTNFDPGAWGENYLVIVKRLANAGYGYPEGTPRNNFKDLHKGGTKPTPGHGG